MLDVIMAVSQDGFVCRDDKDDMSWTGREDKAIFKTVTHGRKLCCGKGTYDLLPLSMKNVTMRLDREVLNLLMASNEDCMLIGGQTVVMAALRYRFVRYVYLTKVNRNLEHGVPDLIHPYLFESGCQFRKVQFQNVMLRIYDARVHI